jgi:pimeloyl-ACP methyl ester carboxylesterase
MVGMIGSPGLPRARIGTATGRHNHALVVQGEDDPYGTAAQVEAVRGAGGPVEVLMVPGARHAPHLEAPDLTRPAIAGFATKVLKG